MGIKSPEGPVDVTCDEDSPGVEGWGHRVATLSYPFVSVSTYSSFSLSLPDLLPPSAFLLPSLLLLLQARMENKAMYLHTVSDRDTGSIFEEPFDGRSLSKLNLCEDGEYLWLSLGV